MNPGDILVPRDASKDQVVLVVHITCHEFMAPDVTVWGFDADEPFVEVLSNYDAVSRYEVDNG